jgi:hypothetical protein
MKDQMPANHALIQMDFSENYNCQTMEEMQSAYWNAPNVTLHPTIIYFNSLSHSSLVFLSELLHNSAAMVNAIVKKLVNTVKNYVPELNNVHFWTDYPSSQYRNRSVFDSSVGLKLIMNAKRHVITLNQSMERVRAME